MSEETLQLILGSLGPIILVILGWVGQALRKRINAQTGNEQLKNSLISLETVTEDVVRFYMQAHVTQLKKDGVFDAKAAAVIRTEALEKIQSMLAPAIVAYLKLQFACDSDEKLQLFLTTKLESILTRVKSNGPTTTTDAV